ncbi:TM2 domain containing protein (modular protein) [Capnocytophaga canimorsus]|uniref:TM2 domain containing protein (Modular protein) n=1 Tax=Capnocytophaga canimorsus TaxID=28188 RepID=A0A0B7HE71_9FLAO|nr:TM2 domain containing protein (modular protein) [Capnocytophaga canimorsus]
MVIHRQKQKVKNFVILKKSSFFAKSNFNLIALWMHKKWICSLCPIQNSSKSEIVPQIRERMLQLDESKWVGVQSLQFKDPTTSLIISILAGGLGIDRFFIGDVGLGVAKLLTCGGLGIWSIVDWFMIQDATRDKNAQLLQTALQ